MRKLTKSLLKSVFVLILVTTTVANARTITLKEAVDSALRISPDIKMAMHQVDAATYAAKAALMNMLPKIKVSANYYRMGPLPTFDFSFTPSNPGAISPDCVKTIACFAQLMKGVNTSTKVGEANNFTFNTQVVQPLTPLFSLYHVKKMKDIEGRTAVIDRETAKETVKLNVKSVYFALLQMKKTREVLDGTLKSLDEHLKQVQAFVRAGAANRVDELRVKVRFGETRSAIAQLEGQYRATLAAFNAMIGLPRDENTGLAEPEHKAMGLKDLNFYRKEALGHRLELSGLRRRLEEAEHGVSLAKSAFIPQASVFAQYGYQYGNDFMPDWSWQVGVGLQWQWEWWKNGYLMDQAEAQAAQLRDGEEALKQGVLAQVDQAYYSVLATRQKLKYWEISVSQAKDVFRLTEDRYKAGTATNTDVLDAQNALLGARASYFAALYGLMMAGETLHEAVYGAMQAGTATAPSAAQGSDSQTTQEQPAQTTGGMPQNGMGTGGTMR